MDLQGKAGYFVGKLIELLVTLLLVSLLVFAAFSIIPGDTARVMLGPEASEAQVDLLRTQLGLDRPLAIRYFSWLFGRKKEFSADARIKGGRRNIIMSGEYDSVLPMDIYGEYLVKAILAEDIDRMEQLGIYEVSPEDFAVAEFVDSSKLPLQQIILKGLDIVRKENE